MGKGASKRIQARVMISPEDELARRLEIAQAERATAEVNLETERLRHSGQND